MMFANNGAIIVGPQANICKTVPLNLCLICSEFNPRHKNSVLKRLIKKKKSS